MKIILLLTVGGNILYGSEDESTKVLQTSQPQTAKQSLAMTEVEKQYPRIFFTLTEGESKLILASIGEIGRYREKVLTIASSLIQKEMEISYRLEVIFGLDYIANRNGVTRLTKVGETLLQQNVPHYYMAHMVEKIAVSPKDCIEDTIQANWPKKSPGKIRVPQ